MTQISASVKKCTRSSKLNDSALENLELNLIQALECATMSIQSEPITTTCKLRKVAYFSFKLHCDWYCGSHPLL